MSVLDALNNVSLKIPAGHTVAIVSSVRTIVRLFLKNPRIIILDETTSALDTKTERSIQSALVTLWENRTSLIVAHRLFTIVDANSILVLQESQVVEIRT